MLILSMGAYRLGDYSKFRASELDHLALAKSPFRLVGSRRCNNLPTDKTRIADVLQFQDESKNSYFEHCAVVMHQIFAI